ncbi:MAG: AraC-like DNA-binding protein [Colwellia sp.]|jgi:AraC-like DNA-binding protein
MIEFIALLLGSAHGVYLSFVLLSKNSKENNANLILSLFILTLALMLFFDMLATETVHQVIPHIIEIDQYFAFLFGPLLYIYVQKLTSSSFYKVNFLHFLPVVIAVIISIPFYWQSGDFKFAFLYAASQENELGLWYLTIFDEFFILIKVVLSAVYLIKTYQCLLQHRTHIADNFSSHEKVNLTWLIRLVCVMSLLFLIWVLAESLDLSAMLCGEQANGNTCETARQVANDTFMLLQLGLVFCIYLISIYGLKQPAIFIINTNRIKQNIQLGDVTKSENITESEVVNLSNKDNKLVIKDEKYQKSSLTEELSGVVFQEISHFINQHKLYLDSELSLSQLALQSGFSKHHLSQAINQCANKTFFDFINFLRVEHAKLLLQAENKMNILEVSVEAGFNSRSSFYNAFKKHTQLTPSQFKKKGTVNSCPA